MDYQFEVVWFFRILKNFILFYFISPAQLAQMGFLSKLTPRGCITNVLSVPVFIVLIDMGEFG